MHLLGTNLHLEGDSVLAHHRGVQALIHVGLGGADIILEPAQHRLIHVMDDPQHIVAFGHGVHNHPEGKQIEHIIQRFVLGIHLPVNAVGMLHPAVDLALNMGLLQPGLDLIVD